MSLVIKEIIKEHFDAMVQIEQSAYAGSFQGTKEERELLKNIFIKYENVVSLTDIMGAHEPNNGQRSSAMEWFAFIGKLLLVFALGTAVLWLCSLTVKTQNANIKTAAIYNGIMTVLGAILIGIGFLK